MKAFLVFATFAIFLLNCKEQKSKQIDFNGIYATRNQSDTFDVRFHRYGDSVKMFYYFIFQNGNYLNFPIDSSDYAGHFTINDIKNDSVSFNVKDYREYWRDSSRVYNLTLHFISDSEFNWFIDSNKYGILDYLPHNIVFKLKKP